MKCKQCVLFNNNKCMYFNISVDKEKDYCSFGVKELEKCDKCGQRILPQHVIIDENGTTILCPSCASQF